MKKIDIRDWTREQWLEYRRSGIGGSDAAAILGLNQYSSPYRVFLDKTGQLEEREDNEAMRQGRDLEDYVAKRWEEATGKKVQRCNFILRSEEHDVMFANVDRMVVGEKAILECKTTSVYNRSDFENGQIPPSYYCQCMHYMAVTGYDTAYLAVLVLNKGFYHFEIKRDEKEIQSLIEAEEKFWNNHVKEQLPPGPDGSDGDAELIKAQYPESTERHVDLMGFDSEMDRLDELKVLKKQIETEEKQLQQSLQLRMGDAELAHCGDRIITWKSVTSNRVDSKKLKALFPEVYAQCVAPSTSRRFMIKQVKEK